VPGEEFCYAQAVDVQGDFCYVLDYGPFPDDDTKGIYIFDISDISNPLLINRFADYQGEGDDMDVVGDYAYVADKLGGMSVVNIADPLVPFNSGYCTLPDSPTGIAVQGQHAYISDYINGGVEVVNVSNPSSPFISAYYKQSGCFAMAVSLSGSLVYIADGPAGIGIYDHYVVTGTESEIASSNKPVFECYPNPLSKYGTVAFAIEGNGIVQLSLFDVSGKKVQDLARRNCPAGENRISFAIHKELTPGIYFLCVDTGSTKDWAKVVVK
jgi:hypothetical protein